jgi:predicted dehydrogenase
MSTNACSPVPESPLAQSTESHEKDQFALETDHMAKCVMRDQQPHTPGERGLQDIRIIEATYESARPSRAVQLKPQGS